MEVTNINGQIRFCAWETYNGARRHYLCNQREYCCALGCCVSTAFSLYQLWYFWLLLLLIILLCSGGGWWFRFRHGGFSARSSPSSARGRQGGGRGTGQGLRVPHQHPFYTSAGLQHGAYTLPPGYDKDPPSYNEVITHLNQFPRIEDVRRQSEQPSTSAAQGEELPMEVMDCHLVPPPPTYEMVLDLKRRESQLTREIEELELEEERNGGEEAQVNSTRSRIRNLLGRIRPRRSTSFETQGQWGLSAASSSFHSSPSSTSSGLFTISGGSLSLPDYYAQGATPTSIEPPMRDYPRLDPAPPYEFDSSSHSDYSSHFVSSPSTSNRSIPSTPSQTDMELVPTAPLEGGLIPPSSDLVPPSPDLIPPSPDPQEQGRDELRVGEHDLGCSRPCTGRSVLSRPATSIGTRALSPPQEVARKTSLPGAVVENEEDRIEETEAEVR
ncbi:histone-lysine N-methyltransferase SETD1A-like [Eriocheir sinensis]|uniref:histone-lysine N-methyltransferase SETD1A-like n=1 Tax=Eriocheir sinensis TaxID=95602 RepID=UPI0021C5AE28|nr:histone-lysine N-methyltransferase SETD1A-like [Eriocheir sinensis]